MMLTNERMGDRLAFQYGDVAPRAIALFGDSLNAQFEAAIGAAVAMVTGVATGPKGVRSIIKSLREDYVIGRTAAGADAAAARRAWGRHIGRVVVALEAVDRRHNPAEKTPSAYRAVASVYAVSTASSLTPAMVWDIFKAEFAAVNIRDGHTYSEVTRPKKEKAEATNEEIADALLASVLKKTEDFSPVELEALAKRIASHLRKEAKDLAKRAGLRVPKQSPAEMLEDIALEAEAAPVADIA